MNKLIIIIAAIVALCSLTVTTVSADNRGDGQGCPASYWRNIDPHQWQEYTPYHQVDALFKDLPDRLEAYKATPLILALNYSDAIPDERLLREGVTAFLNAAHEGLLYPYRRELVPLASIVPTLKRNNPVEINMLADRLEDVNNGICPFVPQTLPEAGWIDLTEGSQWGILLAALILWIGVLLALRGSKGA